MYKSIRFQEDALVQLWQKLYAMLSIKLLTHFVVEHTLTDVISYLYKYCEQVMCLFSSGPHRIFIARRSPNYTPGLLLRGSTICN